MASKPPIASLSDDDRAVSECNRAFYDAFEARDFDAMSDLWLHDDRVSCVHPGWGALHGWAAVAASWATIFQAPDPVQFILTGERVRVSGDVAWSTQDENILSGAGGSTATSVNVFERVAGRWMLVAHHASPVAASAPRGQ